MAFSRRRRRERIQDNAYAGITDNPIGAITFMEASNSLKEQRSIIEDDDLETVLLCQKGDVEAFGVLVDRHQKKMLNVAYRMIGDYEESCDVVQEAFLAAFRSVARFRREARFSTWLYGIVVNCAKNRLIELKQRKDRLRSGDFFPDLPPGKEGCGCGCQAEPLQEDSIQERLEKKELEARVQECIGLLDDGYREILVLRDIQGLSYGEIAEVFKIPPGTVRSRLFRARNSLKDLMRSRIGDFS